MEVLGRLRPHFFFYLFRDHLNKYQSLFRKSYKGLNKSVGFRFFKKEKQEF